MRNKLNAVHMEYNQCYIRKEAKQNKSLSNALVFLRKEMARNLPRYFRPPPSHAGLATRSILSRMSKTNQFETSERTVRALILDNGKWLCSTGEITELLEISDRTLTNWKRQGLTQEKRGLWDLKHVLKWRGQIYNQDVEETKSVDLQRRKLEVEIALKEAQGELARLKTDITNGKYLDRDVITEDYRRFFVVFKSFALSLPRKINLILAKYMEPVEARKVEKDLTVMTKKLLKDFVVAGVIENEKI